MIVPALTKKSAALALAPTPSSLLVALAVKIGDSDLVQ